jgi:hypothetical protein
MNLSVQVRTTQVFRHFINVKCPCGLKNKMYSSFTLKFHEYYVPVLALRTRRVREVTSQLNVPTSLTPFPSHLLRFHFVGCAKRGQEVHQPPSREPSWYLSGRYKCRGGP